MALLMTVFHKEIFLGASFVVNKPKKPKTGLPSSLRASLPY